MIDQARPFVALVAVLCALALTTGAVAEPKDIDGKRTRARRTEVGAQVKDTLGVGDATDWRYVRVEGTGELTVSVAFQPGGGALDLQVTDAKGKVLATADASKPGARTVSLTVSPGIYYIEVSSGAAASYTLDTKLG